jgi:site-specific recombinase
MNLIQRWLHSFRYRQGLDILLSEAPSSSSPLRERVDWLGRLVNWVRISGPIPSELGISRKGRIQSARLKFILQVLENNPAYKDSVSGCLRSIIMDTHSLELFMHVGVPNQQGFIGEFIERVSVALLPRAPDDRNLEFIFSETFRYERDAEWIDQMDPEIFQGWLELFQYESARVNSKQGKVHREIQDALYLLSHSVRSIGLSRIVRNRVAEHDFRKLPFYELTDKVDVLIETQDPAPRALAHRELNETLDRCFLILNEVYLHYRDHGVSIELVYQTERLKALLNRCRTLGQLIVGNEKNSPFIQSFFGLLVLENSRARKIGKLISDNLVLVCQKIVETNAETGEHYITRDRAAYREIFLKALGGGAVTGVTTFFKFALAHLSLPLFFSGVFAFLNYSISFIALQFMGFTLATKQPAMTATVLAERMDHLNDSFKGMDELVDEIIHLIRSQMAAVVGNILMVVPVVVLIDFIYSRWGAHLTDAPHAQQTIESFSILGMTPIYAAGTGVLLWLSSVFAGWYGNWFNFRGLPEAVEHNARLKFVIGPPRAQRLGRFLKNNVSGLAASISLGFLLGMTPQIASFFGFPFDVRHVTLSSGAITGSAMAIGKAVFSQTSFWLAVLGIFSMAVLNLAVSFTLALTVAVWAKKCSAPKRKQIYKALIKKFREQPSIFLIPGKNI